MRRRLLTTALVAAVALGAVPGAGADRGSFSSSDPLLDRIWAASVHTVDLVTGPPVDLDPRGCPVPYPVAILDGVVRDRCPYVGDLAVSGMTLLVSRDDARPLRDMVLLFASLQRPDGAIPASPLEGGKHVLIDYPAYFVLVLRDYVLYTGDTALGERLWSVLTGVLDRWYPTVLRDGLVYSDGSTADYGFVPRRGHFVSYYNALHVLALRAGAQLAGWLGRPGDAQRWRTRAAAQGARVASAFWDAQAGAFKGTRTGPLVHPRDGNVLAALAQVGTPAQRVSALRFLRRTIVRFYGDGMGDAPVWDDPSFGVETDQRVYPFIGSFALEAYFRAGQDPAAFGLLRREFGYMVEHGPGTMWETIGPAGSPPVGPKPSYAHGWSTGAAPALTRWVLGVRPTSPGYATFVVAPHPGNLRRAAGVVPTPHGPIRVSWTIRRGRPVVRVQSPPGTVWTNRRRYDESARRSSETRPSRLSRRSKSPAQSEPRSGAERQRTAADSPSSARTSTASSR